MENFFENKDRRVIPNWRSFNTTTVLGELNSFQIEPEFLIPEICIDDYIEDWKSNRTLIHGSDLMSAAVINNKKENPIVIEAANYILQNKSGTTLSQRALACKILKKPTVKDILENFRDITLDSLPAIVNPESIKKKIREIRSSLLIFQYNPVLYVELSRCYSILGQENGSIKAMRIALHLAPNNRYVLRCATRLFTHFSNDNNDYLEYIHHLIRKSPMTRVDPWLTSAEISVATLLDRSSRFIKTGISLINSKNISPFNFTELASSIGTVELLNGGTKKSREFFKKSLINPNDNSLAQIEWASVIDKQLVIDPSKFGVKMNYEALALDNYHNKEFSFALDNAVKWFRDMPFSKRPILFGSFLAGTILKDQKVSIQFLEAGILSHPNDPQLINNIAYSLALDNNPKDAFVQLEKIHNLTECDDTTQICVTATKGLSFFRIGQPEIGRKHYLEAIEMTKRKNDQYLNRLAILNYAREEIIIRSEYVVPVMDVVSKIPNESKDIEISILKKEVVERFEQIKN